MRKPHKPRPMHVLRAVLERDTTNLMILGWRGNESQKLRKELVDPKIYPIPQKSPEGMTKELLKLWSKKPLWKRNLLLRGAWQKLRQAHEDICPVD